MDALFNDVKTQTTNVKAYWEGEDSEAMLAEIENFQKSFETVKQENEKYANFLNNVINRYSTTEQNISNSIDASSGGFSINGS